MRVLVIEELTKAVKVQRTGDELMEALHKGLVGAGKALEAQEGSLPSVRLKAVADRLPEAVKPLVKTARAAKSEAPANPKSDTTIDTGADYAQ